jgi:serine/threonine protein kinase
MSPEQCRGITEAVDHRADIYALSVILYQMLAGKVPFVSAGTGDVLIMHVSAEAPPVRQANPAVPGFVEATILRGMAKSPEQRFQSMTELADALRSGGAVSNSASPDLAPRSRSTLSRRVAVVGVSAAIAVLVIFMTASIRGGRDRAPLSAKPVVDAVDLRPVPAAAPPPTPGPPPATQAAVDPLPAAPRVDVRSADAPIAPARKPARRTRAALPVPAGRSDAASSPAAPAAPRRARRAKPWL